MFTKNEITKIIEKFNNAGWVAFHYKRLHKIAINGGKMENETQACRFILDCLKRKSEAKKEAKN